jgi:hypothetical protein
MKDFGYTIGRGLDAVLPFTCYYWFSCYFDQRGKLMKALDQLCNRQAFIHFYSILTTGNPAI